MRGINAVELTIVIILFLAVTVMGFAASRWQGGKDLMHLDEWGLGGRSFGSWITWFLLGGDLYTAYTFVAVPALMFGAGAAGFFAVPYTVVIYPLVFLVVIRLWSVSHVRGFVTPADFVRSRFDSPTMALLVAITGIVATMPYIALQLVGISAILKSIGFSGTGLAGDLPLLIAFIVLAATMTSMNLIPQQNLDAGLVLIFAVDRFMSTGRAIVNLIGNGMATVMIAQWEKEIDHTLAEDILSGRKQPDLEVLEK